MIKVVGIDLGTTNSVISIMEGGKPIVIANAEGLRTTPSVVAYTKKKELLIGQIAKRQAILNPENTFFSAKRFIGSKAKEIDLNSQQLPYKIFEDEKGNIKVRCSNLEKDFSPEEISAQVLRKLVNDASKYLGQPVTQAVVTVPAYFNDSQRQATKDAGEIAGIEILRIINEPTAAALAYGLDKKINETILVFDLGGGTFDVSILEVGDGVFEVLSTSGDTNLGGDDFDKAIVNWLIGEFKESEKIDLSKDPQALQRLTQAAEAAKIELSNVLETTINLPFITVTKDGPKNIDTVITRAKFESLCDALISRCKIPVENAIRDAKIERTIIDEVVLVGGSSRIPAVQKLVEELTGKKPNRSVNPDEVVAIGAAIQGAILAGEVKDILLLDVIPLSLGIETVGNLMTKIISRNTTVPTKKSETFSTSTDNQKSVEIHVLQGERELIADNKSLGRFLLDGIPEAPRGVSQIIVTFDIDVNGILSISAEEKSTGIKQSIIIKGSSTLDKEEIDKMLADAEKNAKEDFEKLQEINLKNDLGSFCYQAEKQLIDSDLTDVKKKDIAELIVKIREHLKVDQVKEAELLVESLKSILSPDSKSNK